MGWPSHACLACAEKFDPLRDICPTCRDAVTSVADAPEWFAAVQAHVTAVHANDTAVRLFREGRLESAIHRAATWLGRPIRNTPRGTAI